MTGVRIKRDSRRIEARIDSGIARMTAAVCEQVIADGNFFCRQAQGILMSSALSASIPSKGLAIWDTPYAKRMYYTGTPCTDVNPNASLMWVEKARERFGEEWKKLAQKMFSEGMG